MQRRTGVWRAKNGGRDSNNQIFNQAGRPAAQSSQRARLAPARQAAARERVGPAAVAQTSLRQRYRLKALVSFPHLVGHGAVQGAETVGVELIGVLPQLVRPAQKDGGRWVRQPVTCRLTSPPQTPHSSTAHASAPPSPSTPPPSQTTRPPPTSAPLPPSPVHVPGGHQDVLPLRDLKPSPSNPTPFPTTCRPPTPAPPGPLTGACSRWR